MEAELGAKSYDYYDQIADSAGVERGMVKRVAYAMMYTPFVQDELAKAMQLDRIANALEQLVLNTMPKGVNNE